MLRTSSIDLVVSNTGRVAQQRPGGRINHLLHAALSYAALGWPLFPTRNKRPLNKCGLSGATTDSGQICQWWARWPKAGISIATGESSLIVVLDVDIDYSRNINGLDALDALGIATHLTTSTSHTPRGGIHMFFAWPGHFVKTSAGKLGPGLDIRADGGSITLPPGNGRFWDPHLSPDTPMAPMPGWLNLVAPPKQLPLRGSYPPPLQLNAYAEAALNSAIKLIFASTKWFATRNVESRGFWNRSARGCRRHCRRIGIRGVELGGWSDAFL